MQQIELLGTRVPAFVIDIGLVALSILIAIVVHGLGMRVLDRIARRTPGSTDDIFVEHARRPLRWIAVGIALATVRRFLNLPPTADAAWTQAAGLIVPLLVGSLAIQMIRATGKAIELDADISVADNLRARRRRTRSAILVRIAVFGVGFLTICLMLLSIPSIRSVGVTLMASAGLAGLAVGAAAQPLLKNLIAGIQMAFTEPVRLDDVVIVEGEWGRIEEIRLTYVVVALWDERRLVVPVSQFLEKPFQNWTRNTSQLLGSVFLMLDPAADIDRLRAHAEQVVKANPRWDGRAFVLQVTDSKADAIEVRILATARDAATAFDLRCDIREALLAYVRDQMPEALPRRRVAMDAPLNHRAASGAA
ncbi:hypothetical protein COC42_03615 [Sphingomonas spermidinifaciens]|uniref:Mechanosensitive ion channel MscS domain-containing protein n=1 Tax=Sphingomonas spermidinifaciens TaxID=1141889 RepID=A0A2A4B9D7_9SPHN|nr:hypothetical protein COC42_03615 [Sphingomonas spermidinifaciens]